MVTLFIGLMNLTPQNNITPIDNDVFIAELQDDLLYSMTEDDVLDVIWEQEATADNDSETIEQFNDYIELLTAELD